MSAEPSGTFTGEVSAEMLRDLYVNFVILGHSERRQYFGETNESINLKVLAAVQNNLKPIYCIGETLESVKVKEHLRLSGSGKGGFSKFSLSEVDI